MTEAPGPHLKPRKWWLAALLTILLPGLGQIYNGQMLKAVTVFATIWIFLIIPVSILFVEHLSVTTFLAIIGLLLSILAVIIADAIVNARKADGTYSLKSYNRLYVYFGILIAFVLFREAESWLVKSYVIRAYQIPAASMVPTLLIGDAILVDKLHGSKTCPHRDDVIVFEYPADPEKEFIKRVESIPGDVVEIRNKALYRNSKLVKADCAIHLDNSVIPAEKSPRDNYGPVVVPPDSVFVLGDNRESSLDSRFFGFVNTDRIKGVAKCIYFSWDRQNKSVRWDRIAKQIQ